MRGAVQERTWISFCAGSGEECTMNAGRGVVFRNMGTACGRGVVSLIMQKEQGGIADTKRKSDAGDWNGDHR